MSGKVVLAAWKIANGLGAAGANMGMAGRSGDNDRLLLDWDEYQVQILLVACTLGTASGADRGRCCQECICVVAEKAGVPLSGSRKPISLALLARCEAPS